MNPFHPGSKHPPVPTTRDNDCRKPVQQLDEAPSLRDAWRDPSLDTQLTLSVVVMGGSGDLAKKKTYPALFALFCKGFLPKRTLIIGYARSPMDDNELRQRIKPFLLKVVDTLAQQVAASNFAPPPTLNPAPAPANHQQQQGQQQQQHNVDQEDVDIAMRVLNAERAAKEKGMQQVESFLQLCTYQTGEYDDNTPGGKQGYQQLTQRLCAWEGGHPPGVSPFVGRLLYLALPPAVYPQACAALHRHAAQLIPGCKMPESWVRIILEKPFGKDLCSSERLAGEIGALWPEESLYRIDHYLGKELVQNLLVLRFANNLFSSWWNRDSVANVQITFKENFGTQGRGGYFDQYGIIRDVMQNHLAQVLALLAMEPPVSLHPDDVRDEKVKLLRCVVPPKEQDCVLGQYVAGDGNPGYMDDPTVPKGSLTPTFASVRLFIHNDRWAGVPFIMKAGKALNDRTALVRIQLKSPAAPLFGNMDNLRNELVIRFQPEEAIYAKLVVKKPGLEMDYVMSELDLTYPERYRDLSIPDAYERLILDCMRGDQQHFVRRDELRAAWAIFTPLLHAIDAKQVKPPHPYAYGSRGPDEADQLVVDAGYRSTQYEWTSYDARRSHDGLSQSGRAAPAKRVSELTGTTVAGSPATVPPAGPSEATDSQHAKKK